MPSPGLASVPRDEAQEPIPDSLRTEELLVAQKRTLEMMVRGAPLREVLTDLARTVESLAAGTAVASILLVDGDKRLWTGAAPSLPDAYNAAIDGLQASADLGTCSVAAVTGQVVITRNIARDPKWQTLKSLPLELGLVAAWSQPIFASDGRVLATFGTYFRERREPTSLERRLVETLSHTAALAIERNEAQSAIEKQQRLLDRALDAAEMGAWRYDLTDHTCEFGLRAQQLYGLSDATFLHDEAGVVRLLHPEDVPVMWAAVAKATNPDGDGRYSVEYRVQRPDGGWRWLSVWGLAEFEGEGRDRRAVVLAGASRDVSDRKAADHQQALLMDELNHRVKNNLAIVQSIAGQTLRSTPQPAEFAKAFMARISALARAHTLLTRALWQGAALKDVAAVTLEGFGYGSGEGAIRVEGPSVAVDARAAVTLCLILHELATNAAKYGALSTPTGAVTLIWTTERGSDGESRVELLWREAGGPPVSPPARRGFGSRLLQASADQLGGSATLQFLPEGVVCALALPVAAAVELGP